MDAGLVAAAAGSLLADQVSKLLVLSPRIRPDDERRVRGRPGSGRPIAVRWGIPLGALWLAWIVIAAGAALAPAAGWFTSAGAQAGLGLALGGAGGNLLDVAVRGGVVDFIDVRIWPAFNLADVAIVVGVVMALAFV